jgi:hypothetical protein
MSPARVGRRDRTSLRDPARRRWTRRDRALRQDVAGSARGRRVRARHGPGDFDPTPLRERSTERVQAPERRLCPPVPQRWPHEIARGARTLVPPVSSPNAALAGDAPRLAPEPERALPKGEARVPLARELGEPARAEPVRTRPRLGRQRPRSRSRSERGRGSRGRARRAVRHRARGAARRCPDRRRAPRCAATRARPAAPVRLSNVRSRYEIPSRCRSPPALGNGFARPPPPTGRCRGQVGRPDADGNAAHGAAYTMAAPAARR